MKNTLILLFCLALFYGCGPGYFLSDEVIKDYLNYSNRDNHTVYYEKKYEIDESGNVLESTHCVTKLSGDVASRSEYIFIHLNSMDKLAYFQARIVNKDGSTITYRKSDLFKHNVSGGGNFSEETSYVLILQNGMVKGDLVEYAYGEKVGFSPLGFIFDLDESGSSADEVTCKINAPDKFRVNFLTLNDSLKPSVSSTDGITTYTFQWMNYHSLHADDPLMKLNYEPGIAFCFSNKDIGNNSWISYGNWYLELIENKITATPEIKSLAEQLTSGKSDPKDKMDAIFNYCQKNIRYEQSAIKGGEIIPNECQLILNRKFGDCKDYSAIIYAMAKSLGIDAHMALCYRGRGLEFYDIPVSQFNHAIVHFSHGGKDFWYDGTNRISEPGITTFDLANQKALIIEKDNSRIVTIKEEDNNLLNISGTLKDSKDGFNADLKLTFTKQFAIDFLYYGIFLKRSDMADLIIRWIKRNLSSEMAVTFLDWTNKDDGSFEIKLRGRIPNSVTRISPALYTSISRIFPDLFYDTSVKQESELFYFPNYNKVSIDITLPELNDPETGNGSSDAHLEYSYNLPIGPFTETNSRDEFISSYNKVFSDIHKKIKLITRNAK